MKPTFIQNTATRLRALGGHSVKRTALLASLMAFLCLPVAAAPPPNGSGNRPRVIFDEDSTPLQRALEQTVKNKRNQMRGSSPACDAALLELEDLEAREAAGEEIDPKVKERAEKQAAAKCKVPRVKKEKFGKDKCPDCGDKMNPAGKVVGKKIATETTLDFATPDERGRGKWADVDFPARLMNPLAGQGAVGGANGVRVRSAALFADSSSNDDKDCVDRVTGARKGGLDPTTSMPFPDGDPASCFAASGELKATLEVISGGCRHIETGATFSGDPSDGFADDCYDESGALQTTLEELVDEDPSEAGDEDGDGMHGEDPPGDVDADGNPNDDNDCLSDAGDIRQGAACVDAGGKLLAGFMWLVDEDGDDPIDQDEDGFFDEDPPVASEVAAACNAAGGDLVGEDGCDLSRAVIAAVNRQAMEEHGMKIFKADENGVCDSEMPGEVDCGAEARKVKLTETFVVRCEPGAEFVDGECVTPVELAPASAKSFSFPHMLSPGAGPAVGVLSPEGVSVTDEAMMGFTFAPPVIEWGYKIEEEACVDIPAIGEVCAEVFFARVGYEFNIAAGLRLPIQVTIEDLPDEGTPPPYARAETQATLTSKIEPLDFTAQQYKDFCQEHHLDQERFIANCDRFSFPEFLSSTVNQFLPGAVTVDGSEFVGRAVIFAGLQVRVAMVPVVSYGIDVDLDVPTLCTFNQIFNLNDPELNISLLNFANDAGSSLNILKAVKDSGLNCASFTTPWGFAPDPITQVPRLRTFPLAGSFTIPADCAEALVVGPRVNIKGKVRPICTGILVGMNGASMGIDLGLELAFGSTLITADWDVSGDAATSVGNRTAFYEDLGTPTEPQLGPITFDNYSSASDYGVVTLDDFTYLLNAFQLRLSAKLGFGGILSPIPDIADFTLLTIVFSGGQLGIPIPQHAGTEPIQVPVFVENHALSLHATPETLLIKPGEFGQFTIGVDNLGSVSGTMDQFTRALSNIRNQNSPFLFEINQNTDYDCVDSATGTEHFRGDPYDGIVDDCFTAGGEVQAGRTETINEDDLGPAGQLAAVRDEDGDGLADEDPPDVWATMPDAATFGGQSIQSVPAHSTASQTLTLSVSPFRHPLTAPGLYPVQITADSQEARAQDLAPQDPVGQTRLDASDVVFIQVESFFDPQVVVQPDTPAAKPGVSVNYTFESSNGGNTADTVLLSAQFIDFNQAGCTLTTLGSGAGCPYRAVPTQIPSAQWTTVAGLGESFGPLEPLGVAQRNFTIRAPSDWAGMEDTTYEVIFTGTSASDPEAPPAKNSAVIRHTVIATKESMTRYIGLEVDELIVEIENARAQGVRTGGTLPIAQRAVKSTNDRALQNILAGNLAGASRNHAANIRIMQGFLRALDGARPPASFADDWRARANAIINDMTLAQASNVASAAAGPATTAKVSRKR